MKEFKMARSNKPNNRVLGDKLQTLRGDIRTRPSRKPGSRQPLPSTERIGEDGIDHINIWENGKTDLGQSLSHSVKLGFEHKKLGPFASIESFWYYLTSVDRDDRLRTMTGPTLKRNADRQKHRRLKNFFALIMDANYQKVLTYKEIKEEIVNSTLPFDCYYNYRRSDGVRIRPSFAVWLVRGFEEIRLAIQENREPDFSPLMDTDDLYEDLFQRQDHQPMRLVSAEKGPKDTSGQNRDSDKLGRGVLLVEVHESRANGFGDLTQTVVNVTRQDPDEQAPQWDPSFVGTATQVNRDDHPGETGNASFSAEVAAEAKAMAIASQPFVRVGGLDKLGEFFPRAKVETTPESEEEEVAASSDLQDEPALEVAE